MANGVLGTYIATFTTTNIVSNANASFAHGLGAAPDIVIVRNLNSATIATESNKRAHYSADATNITLYATGLPTGTMQCTAIVAHSIIS